MTTDLSLGGRLNEMVQAAQGRIADQVNRQLFGEGVIPSHAHSINHNHSVGFGGFDTRSPNQGYWSTVPLPRTYTDGTIQVPTLNEYIRDRLSGTATQKEKEMTTNQIVSNARAERKKEQATQLLTNIEREMRVWEKLPGTFITGKAKFPDNETEYHYGWMYGTNKQWWRTGKLGSVSTEGLIDELVQIALDADRFSWEIVGIETRPDETTSAPAEAAPAKPKRQRS